MRFNSGRTLGSKHNIMPKGTIEWGTLRQNFLEGKTAIMWHSTGNLTVGKRKRPSSISAWPCCRLASGEAHPPVAVIFIFSNKRLRRSVKAAMRVIKFMTNPERSAEWSMKTGYMGISQAAYDTAKLQEYVKDFPYAAVARDQLEYATAELSTYETGRIRKALDDAIQAALTDAKTPEAALNEAQALSDRLLKQYR